LRKNPASQLLLGGAAVYRCDNQPVFIAALQFEKLWNVLASVEERRFSAA
jgi:hypothetical protein